MINTHYEVWDDNTYEFPDINGTAVECWWCIRNFTTHFAVHAII